MAGFLLAHAQPPHLIPGGVFPLPRPPAHGMQATQAPSPPLLSSAACCPPQPLGWAPRPPRTAAWESLPGRPSAEACSRPWPVTSLQTGRRTCRPRRHGSCSRRPTAWSARPPQAVQGCGRLAAAARQRRRQRRLWLRSSHSPGRWLPPGACPLAGRRPGWARRPAWSRSPRLRHPPLAWVRLRCASFSPPACELTDVRAYCRRAHCWLCYRLRMPPIPHLPLRLG